MISFGYGTIDISKKRTEKSEKIFSERGVLLLGPNRSKLSIGQERIAVMSRKLFCELSPAAYQISAAKCRIIRHLKNLFCLSKFSRTKSPVPLEHLVWEHRSRIRRRLGNVDMALQENKAVNLRLAAPKVTGILISPGELFSFWHLVGRCSSRKGYREGLTIRSGRQRHRRRNVPVYQSDPLARAAYPP